MSNANFPTDIISSTLHKYEKKIRSNILDQDVVLKILKEKALDEVSGGRKLAYPQITQENSTFQSYSGADELVLAEQEGLTHAEYDWAQYAGSIVLPGIDEFKNSDSSSRILPLLETKIQQLEETATSHLGEKVFTAQAGTEINGLPDLISTSNNTVGGINSSTHSYWRNNKDASVSNFGTTMNGVGMAGMNSMMKDCMKTNKSPDVIITTQTIHEYIENVLVQNQRFLGNEASWGFEAMPFKGAKIFFDDNATAEAIYFLNTEDLRLVVGKGKNFKLDQKPSPANQDIKVWTYLVYLQLVAKRRRTQGIMSGISSQS